MSSLNCCLALVAGDAGKTSDDISLTLVESCSHDHGEHGGHTRDSVPQQRQTDRQTDVRQFCPVNCREKPKQCDCRTHGWQVMTRARTSQSAASATRYDASAATAQQKHTQTSETLPTGLIVLTSVLRRINGNRGQCSMLCTALVFYSIY